MELFKPILILAIIFLLLAILQFYHSWKDFKKLKIGDEISREFSDKFQKMIKIANYLLVVGLILSLIGTIIRPY